MDQHDDVNAEVNGYIADSPSDLTDSDSEKASRPHRRDTYFAPAGRAMTGQLRRAARVVESNPVTNLLMRTYGSVLAILNEHRQIVAVNDCTLKALGVREPDQLLGLRPGEALNCIHAKEGPDGCGTGKTCRTCGAALTILAARDQDIPSERECYITVPHGRQRVTREYLARAVPIRCESERFTVLMLQDISDSKRRESLERTFYHDVHNTLAALKGTVDLMVLDEQLPDTFGERLSRLTMQVLDEIDLQRDMNRLERGDYHVERSFCTPRQIVAQVQDRFKGHHLSADRDVRFSGNGQAQTLHTSLPLASRVLRNMVLNAMEATPPGGRVRIWWVARGGRVVFKVWNAQWIRPETARRVFERNYSTKDGHGRGVGTYSMKLLGEGYLNGEVSFVTSPTRGTIFRFALPACKDGDASNR